jgi:hypothetical protein
VDVNRSTTADGYNPLIVACIKEHAEIVQLLLACDRVDVNWAGTNGVHTPLFNACSEGHAETVQLLLACDGVDVNQPTTNDGSTPLHGAAFAGLLGVAQHLVAFGANMTAIDHGGATARKLAIKQEHPDVVKWFDAVAGWSTLRIAAGCRLHAAITIQLKRGTMDPDALSMAEIRLALAAAATAAPELPWSNAPAVCPLTVQVLQSATLGWSRSTHWLHHARVRATVRTLLLVSERLHRVTLRRRGRSTSVAVGTMPPEMWVRIMCFFRRGDWPAHD